MKTFQGFSLPDGAWLPPELMHILPEIETKAELKIVIAAIYHAMQVGGSEPLSIADFEHITGLAHQSVIDGIRACTTGRVQTLDRHQWGRSFTYTLKMNETPPPLVVQKLDSQPRESDSIDTLSRETDSLSDSLGVQSLDSRLSLVRQLRAAGVFLKTAQAIVNTISPEKIEEKIEFYRYALEKRLAQGPGWLVLAIKEDWPQPLGYTHNDSQRYISGKFAQYIES